MATDELNSEVVPSTFAAPEPTELERLQERIRSFKVNVTPAVAQFSQILMQQALEKPTKIEDLDAFITIRNELKEGLDEYQLQLTNAQKRMVQLTEEHNQQKQMEIARVQQDLQDARNAERKRRKDAEARTRQLEAVLASHGINIDLDGDGQIGLVEGETEQPLDVEQQKSLKELLDESKAAAAVTTVSTPSKAWESARALNPEPLSTSQELMNELEPIPPVRTDPIPVEIGGVTSSTKPEVVLPVPEDAKGTEEFLEEVKTVDEADEEAIERMADEGGSIGYDANGSPTSDFAVPQSETTGTIGITKKPVISDSNSPAVIKAEVADITKLNVRIVPEEEIADFEARANGIQASDFPTTEHDESDDLEAAKKVEEDEFEEVVVPTESELKGMTKSKIRAEALKLGFDTVSTKESKSKMIAQFTLATEQFISDLQDSGEFVSASAQEEEGNETDSDDDVRDGGYFN